MYYTGLDPRTMKPVYVAKDHHEKELQRALLQWKRPEKRRLVIEALKAANREDLIGFDKKCLVRPDSAQGSGYKGKPKDGAKASPDKKGKSNTAPAPAENIKVSGRAKGLGGKTATVTTSTKPSSITKKDGAPSKQYSGAASEFGDKKAAYGTKKTNPASEPKPFYGAKNAGAKGAGGKSTQPSSVSKQHSNSKPQSATKNTPGGKQQGGTKNSPTGGKPQKRGK